MAEQQIENSETAEILAQALDPKGLCHIHVIMRTLEEMLSCKELYALLALRCQQSSNFDLKAKSTLLA